MPGYYIHLLGDAAPKYLLCRPQGGHRGLLRGVSASAEYALSKARELLMATDADAVQDELERLGRLHEELDTLAALR